MGSTRMGVERISKHEDQLDGRGRMSEYTGFWYLVGYSQGLRRHEQREWSKGQRTSIHRVIKMPDSEKASFNSASTTRQSLRPPAVAFSLPSIPPHYHQDM